jgi:AraC-like DNA-binding protein
MYREFLPPPEHRHAIACLWLRRGAREPVRIIPDGCIDIVWSRNVGASVAGPDTSHWFSAPGTGEPIVGVRFRPGAGGPALGLPLSELRDHRVALEDLDRALARSLGASDDPRIVAPRLAALAAELVTTRSPDRAVQAAAARLGDSRARVDRVADELGFSERQLRRRFDDAVGYGPKTLQRVLRLRRFLAGPDTDMAAAAIDAGYADQAHLARECRALTGLAPSELVSAGGADHQAPTPIPVTPGYDRRIGLLV